jgi:hypothetical protein
MRQYDIDTFTEQAERELRKVVSRPTWACISDKTSASFYIVDNTSWTVNEEQTELTVTVCFSPCVRLDTDKVIFFRPDNRTEVFQDKDAKRSFVTYPKAWLLKLQGQQLLTPKNFGVIKIQMVFNITKITEDHNRYTFVEESATYRFEKNPF